MTIVDFIESKHGRSIRQNRLYRKLKRWVQEEASYQSPPIMATFSKYGFRVEEDERGQYHYEVTNPKRFRKLALELGGWRQPSPEEIRALLRGAKLLLDIADGRDDRWELRDKMKGEHPIVQLGRALAGGRDELLDELRSIVDRSMPSP